MSVLPVGNVAYAAAILKIGLGELFCWKLMLIEYPNRLHLIDMNTLRKFLVLNHTIIRCERPEKGNASF